MFNYINMMHPDGCQYWAWGLIGYCKQSHLHPTVCLYSMYVLTLCLSIQYCMDGHAGGLGAAGLLTH